jgi:hypothetical protein
LLHAVMIRVLHHRNGLKRNTHCRMSQHSAASLTTSETG